MRCGEADDGILHAIRDCRTAKEVWERLLPSDLASEFFLLDPKGWVLWMLRKGSTRMGTPQWSEKIVMMCLLQCRWRNVEVFHGCRLDLQQRIKQVVDYFVSVSWARSV